MIAPPCTPAAGHSMSQRPVDGQRGVVGVFARRWLLFFAAAGLCAPVDGAGAGKLARDYVRDVLVFCPRKAGVEDIALKDDISAATRTGTIKSGPHLIPAYDTHVCTLRVTPQTTAVQLFVEGEGTPSDDRRVGCDFKVDVLLGLGRNSVRIHRPRGAAALVDIHLVCVFPEAAAEDEEDQDGDAAADQLGAEDEGGWWSCALPGVDEILPMAWMSSEDDSPIRVLNPEEGEPPDGYLAFYHTKDLLVRLMGDTISPQDKRCHTKMASLSSRVDIALKDQTMDMAWMGMSAWLQAMGWRGVGGGWSRGTGGRRDWPPC